MRGVFVQGKGNFKRVRLASHPTLMEARAFGLPELGACVVLRAFRMIYPSWIALKWTMLIVGVLLLAGHALALLAPEKTRQALRAFPRDRAAGIYLTVAVAVWFFLMVKHMDLGEFTPWRSPVLVLTPLAALLMIAFVQDFLAVRALGALALMAAEPLLESAWMRDEPARLLLVVLCYVWIVAGMFWVGMPYVLRDQIAWLTASETRWRVATFAGLAYGIALCAGSLFC